MAPSEQTVAYQDVASDSGADTEPVQRSWPARRRLIALITGTLMVAALTTAGMQRARAPREDTALRGPAAVPVLGPEDGLISYSADSNLTEDIDKSGLKTELHKFGHMDCGKYPYMKIMKVKHDNLGGKGPDKGDHSLIYDVKVMGGPSDGDEFEIHFRVTSPEKDFKPQAPKEIGLQGKYGSINLKADSNVTLLIRAFDPKTKKVIPFKSFFFTFFDLDEGPDHHATESIVIHHFAQAVISEHSQVKVEKLATGGLKLSATKEGSGDDNPKDPTKLTKGQFQKAVTVWVKDQDHFEATFSVGPSIKKEGNPRWFNFRGQPSLLCAVRKDGTHPKLKQFLDTLGPKELAEAQAKAAAAAKALAAKAEEEARKAKELAQKKKEAAEAEKKAEEAKKAAAAAQLALEEEKKANATKENLRLTQAAADKAAEEAKKAEEIAKKAKADADAAAKKKSGSSSSHLGGLVILLTAFLSSASLRRPAA